ncbi:nucleopolyhedrovirus P10 family protein [Streptomyces echinoruber]|uniref:nucleopolyhedrovirus P10 family protein n=1 Tax=Streptomyces echinoruber TaxID=68898 RepID=UPI0036099690
MTWDGWAGAVRRQVALGRLLPLGGPRDGAWITERAAGAVLRQAVSEVPGVRLGPLRIEPADPGAACEPVVPPPPSALPPGPLRISADCAAGAREPLPTAAARLRTALATAAVERLGLAVTAVDLRVTELLETAEPAPGTAEAGGEGRGGGSKGGREVPAAEGGGPAGGREARVAGGRDLAGGDDEARVAEAAGAVAGVDGLTGVLGGLGRAVHIEARQGGTATVPRRHVRVEVAVRADHRAVDVARAVRAAVTEALADRPTVAVLVTAVTATA